MMKTIKLERHIWASYNNHNKDFDFHVYSSEGGSKWLSDHIYIAPYTIEIEMPEGLDLHKIALTALQDKRKLILAKNESNLVKVDAEIQEFLAIEQK